jgi:hypothetical protein
VDSTFDAPAAGVNVAGLAMVGALADGAAVACEAVQSALATAGGVDLESPDFSADVVL